MFGMDTEESAVLLFLSQTDMAHTAEQKHRSRLAGTSPVCFRLASSLFSSLC
jgi:hypothetical protein